MNYQNQFNELVKTLGLSKEEADEALNTCEGEYRTACEMVQEQYAYRASPRYQVEKASLQSFFPPPETSKPKKERDYSFLWFLVILAALWLWGQYDQSSSNVDTPQYPGDQSSEASEFNADMSEQDTRTYDPGAGYDLPPEDSDPNIYPDVDPDTLQMSCPIGCTTYVEGCDIKGNISFDTGERIYHVPGQEFYESTAIDPAYGERWFCTEAEARAAGWRKSKK